MAEVPKANAVKKMRKRVEELRDKFKEVMKIFHTTFWLPEGQRDHETCAALWTFHRTKRRKAAKRYLPQKHHETSATLVEPWWNLGANLLNLPQNLLAA